MFIAVRARSDALDRFIRPAGPHAVVPCSVGEPSETRGLAALAVLAIMLFIAELAAVLLPESPQAAGADGCRTQTCGAWQGGVIDTGDGD
jgi:hypothetical protein